MAALGAATMAQGAYHAAGQVLAGGLLAGALFAAWRSSQLRAAMLRFPPVAAYVPHLSRGVSR